MNKSEKEIKNLERLINKYKNLNIDETTIALLDENRHEFGGLEFIFNNALRSSIFNNWPKGQLLTARRIFQGLVDIESKEKTKYTLILEKIQLEIDK